MVDMMRRLPEHDPLVTRGLFRHPADKAPRPATAGGIVAVRFGRDEWGQQVEEEVDWRTLELSGDGYPDGAFFPHPVRDLGRAGWSLVTTDGMGNKTAEIRGPVCSPLPQSPQAAEYVAITATASVFAPGLDLFPECANVVRDFNRPFCEQLNGKKRYAGLLKEAQRHSGWREVSSATWQKAHLNLDGLHGVELRRARGNGAADRSAKRAAKEGHETLPVALDRQARWHVAAAEATLKVADAVLRLFPQDSVRAPRVAIEQRTTMRRTGGHSWCPFHGGRRCSRCLAVSRARSQEEADRKPCLALPPAMRRLVASPKGHELMMLRYGDQEGQDAGAPALVVCLCCGGQTARCTRTLSRPCTKPSVLARRAAMGIRRIQRGWHPTKHKRVERPEQLQAGWLAAVEARDARQHLVPVTRRRQRAQEEPAVGRRLVANKKGAVQLALQVAEQERGSGSETAGLANPAQGGAGKSEAQSKLQALRERIRAKEEGHKQQQSLQ